MIPLSPPSCICVTLILALRAERASFNVFDSNCVERFIDNKFLLHLEGQAMSYRMLSW